MTTRRNDCNPLIGQLENLQRRKWPRCLDHHFAWIVSFFLGMCFLFTAWMPTLVAAQTTSRVSVASNGAEGNDDSGGPIVAAGIIHDFTVAISGNGRFIAFPSDASNLVAGDTNNVRDIFVHDRQTGQTTRVSVASTGAQSNGPSKRPALSWDGRFVAFESGATNLVSGDTNVLIDVFVHDRQTGQTTRVSVDSTGAQTLSGGGTWPSISDDGRFVAFQSGGGLLVAGDTNGGSDVFVHDRQTGQTTRVSVDSTGAQGNGPSQWPSISGDGRFVAFVYDDTRTNNLVANDTNHTTDIFVHDRQTGQTTRVSVDSTGAQSNGPSFMPSISGDGRFVAFDSTATNLVPGDSNTKGDVFVHDRQTGQTTRASVSSSGAQGNSVSQHAVISVEGRFVAFESAATTLVAGDTNGDSDVFVHDRQTGQTTRVSVDSTGAQGNAGGASPAITGDGELVAFASASTNLVVGDTNLQDDVFVHGLGILPSKNPSQTDLDGNGTEDLLWRNVKSGVVVAWYLTGPSINSTAVLAGVPQEWQIAGIGDVNGDSKADVIWRNMLNGVVAVWFMNGKTIASVGFPASAPLVWTIEAIGDLDGNGVADLVWRNSLTGQVVVWLMHGGTILATGSLGIVPKEILIKGVGDTNGDGKADVIRYNTSNGEVTVWLMDGVTINSTVVAGTASTAWAIQGVGDMNGDGQVDLLWRNINSGVVAGWLLKGGTLDSSTFFAGVPSAWQIAQVGDVDGNGKADVIWYNTLSGTVACWLLNGLTIASVGFPGSASTDWLIAGKPLLPNSPPVSITTASTLSAGTVGQAYNVSIGVTGGTPPFSWSVISGSLPPLLTLNPSTGQISGTPATAGNFLATIQVHDGAIPPQYAQKVFSLTINNAPQPPPPTGGGGGTLTVSGAPAAVGGTFIPNVGVFTTKNTQLGLGILTAGEAAPTRDEGLTVSFAYATGELAAPAGVTFSISEGNAWGCSGSYVGLGLPSLPSSCKGVTVNRSAGTVTFSNTVLDISVGSASPITLNGTLTFPPF